MKKQLVAVLGAKGFVGENICNAILKSNKYTLLPYTRESNIDNLDLADVIIHSANPAKRIKAENNPEKDFEETVEKTYNFFNRCKNKRFILISSMSARTQLYTNYGRNRRASELLIQTGNTLTIRLGPMFGGNRKEDMLHDILFGRDVYVSEDTQYSYVDVDWAGQKIIDYIDGPTGITEIGAFNSVRLGDIKTKFNSKSQFLGKIENQITSNFYSGPDANEVYVYAEKEYNMGICK
jgi:nucleoside-diphosphate-sugar epimerase